MSVLHWQQQIFGDDYDDEYNDTYENTEESKGVDIGTLWHE
ncbi:unnamed protein product [Meloidogyne enterolobii]|uniref:Uncharacterized protein n=1 Tax=Meloidogyne enterolobii TaxID=390850 RepID=A0ACB0ZSL3_MELEN